MKLGKLIVIDGGDGAGKATQVAMLAETLKKAGFEVETLDFPRYKTNTFGALIRECLDGKRGDFMKVDARVASSLYAADRFESRPQLEAWLKAGKIVILDRFVSANMMHQGAKIHDEAELHSFLDWLDHMEHEIFGLPRPDAIIYLAVPAVVREGLKATAVKEGKHGAATDLAEADAAHQRNAEERARTIVASKNNWHAVNCCKEESMRTREEIQADIYEIVKNII